MRILSLYLPTYFRKVRTADIEKFLMVVSCMNGAEIEAEASVYPNDVVWKRALKIKINVYYDIIWYNLGPRWKGICDRARLSLVSQVSDGLRITARRSSKSEIRKKEKVKKKE